MAGTAAHHRDRGEKIGLLWFDAHGDMNIPGVSPSGNIHGMPLAHLLGKGDEDLKNILGFSPKISPENVALIGIPWYNVVGNHDINFDSPTDKNSDETFHRHFGPNYYSFDYGAVHFIVLDDVEWSHQQANGKRGYIGGLDEDQLTFVKNDLALVPEKKLATFRAFK